MELGSVWDGGVMGFGKRLGESVFGIVGGVGAIAAAQFTGGGSIIGAATLLTSLAGVGTVAAAAGAGVAGAAAGAYLANDENKKDEESAKKDLELSKLRMRAEKMAEDFQKTINRFKGDAEFFNYIIALSAMGIAMANANGEIHENEKAELEEFVGGVAKSNFPTNVKNEVERLWNNPPTFQESMKYMEYVAPENYATIKEVLEVVMDADGIRHKEQLKFLQDYEVCLQIVKYKPVNDTDDTFLKEAKSRFA